MGIGKNTKYEMENLRRRAQWETWV